LDLYTYEKIEYFRGSENAATLTNKCRGNIHKDIGAQFNLNYIRHGLLSFLVNESGAKATAVHFRQ